MFDDLSRSIETLLKAELPADLAQHVAVSFVTPDETFPPPSLALPAINFFLFEIQENTALRDTEPVLERAADGSVTRIAPPVRVDCHYLVTAVAPSQVGGSEADEGRILGAVLKVLLRHRQLPLVALQGALKGLTPPVRTVTARPGAAALGLDIWQSLKGKPRASLHYLLTVPVDVSAPESVASPVGALRVGGV